MLVTGNSDDALVSIERNNPRPVLLSLSPAARLVGSAEFDLTLHGEDFLPGAFVLIGGQGRATTFVSRTQLRVRVLASDIAAAGDKGVVVINPQPAPAFGLSNGALLSVVASADLLIPSVDAFNTNGIVAGSGDQNLEVSGQNFIATSTVFVNGVARPTSFVSATQLRASLPASDFAGGGTLAVTVKNTAMPGQRAAARWHSVG